MTSLVERALSLKRDYREEPATASGFGESVTKVIFNSEERKTLAKNADVDKGVQLLDGHKYHVADDYVMVANSFLHNFRKFLSEEYQFSADK